MIVIGLTGGIATGKSTVARMFALQHVPIFDADKAVHQLLQAECAQAVARIFPDCARGENIDRKALGEIVFSDAKHMQKLEVILHPAVREKELQFLRHHRMRGSKSVLLDIPLLFETGADALCDIVAVTYCPPFMQWQRALQRPGMSQARLAGVLAQQMTQEERIHRSDFVIPTHQGKAVSMREVKRVMRSILL